MKNWQELPRVERNENSMLWTFYNWEIILIISLKKSSGLICWKFLANREYKRYAWVANIKKHRLRIHKEKKIVNENLKCNYDFHWLRVDVYEFFMQRETDYLQNPELRPKKLFNRHSNSQWPATVVLPSVAILLVLTGHVASSRVHRQPLRYVIRFLFPVHYRFWKYVCCVIIFLPKKIKQYVSQYVLIENVRVVSSSRKLLRPSRVFWKISQNFLKVSNSWFCMVW